MESGECNLQFGGGRNKALLQTIYIVSVPLLYPISYVREQDLGAEVQRAAVSLGVTQSKQTLTR